MHRLVAILILASVALTGTTVAGAASSGGPLSKITIEGDTGEKPTLKFAKPFDSAKTLSQEIATGTGDKLVKNAKVTFDFVVVDGRTGKELGSSFGTTPASAVLDKKQILPGIVNGLIGAAVGSRVLVAIAPKEGLAKGLQTPGVKKNDTLLFVVDVKSRRTPLARATGAAVTPAAGLPGVQLEGSTGKPAISVTGTAAPGELVVQPLIKGTGAAVTAGQTISVHYTGVIWASGKQFDSSWDRGQPIDFGIGTGQVIKGWDEGLVGQTIGSQVLVVVPPDKGYGTAGQSGAGISGTDTLIFVVDILDAY
ncbi:MAG: FKBP-type peptidyl-prolyl cis-trans isomerase [Acidimicrobiia bacterium]